MQILTVTALVLFMCILLWKRRRFYYTSFKLKGPTALPIIGNLLEIQGSVEGANESLLFIPNSTIHFADAVKKSIQLADDYGGLFKFWLGPKFAVYTVDPSHFETILNHPNALCKHDIYDFMAPIARQGIFTCKDSKCFSVIETYCSYS